MLHPESSPSSFESEIRNAQTTNMDQELEERSNILFRYVAGNLSYLNGQYDEALEYLKDVSNQIPFPVEKLHWTLSELYMRNEQREDARREVEKALLANPNNSRYHFMLAILLASAGELEEAEKHYKEMLSASEDPIQGAFFYYAEFLQEQGRREEAISLVVDHIDEAEDVGMALWVLGDLYESSNDLKKAQEVYEDGIKRGGLNEKLFSSLGRLYMLNNDIQAARELCEQMVELEPFNYRANLLLAQLLVAENKLDEAVVQFNRLLEDTTALEGYEYSKIRDVRLELAQLEARRENYGEAERQLLLILTDEPQNDSVRYELASLYVSTGRRIKAFDLLEEIPHESSFYLHARYLLAFILREDGNPVRAVKELRLLLEHYPEHSAIWARLVTILSEMNREDEALEAAREGLVLHGDNESLLFEQARVLDKLGQQAGALEIMEQIIALNPDHAYALNYIAYALAEREIELERAEKLVVRALKIRPEDGYFLDTLGWIHFKRGNLKAAKQYIEKAVQLTEGDIVILEHIGDVLQALGETAKAEEAYGKVLQREAEDLSADEREAVERIRRKRQREI